MDFIKVPNLDKHQHYKNRRPPWMKLHATLLQDYEFSLLTDAEKYQLIALWLLATQLDNKIPCDEKWLCNNIQATKINLSKFIKLGMLVQYDSKALAECKQSALVETETETETETDRFDEFWKLYDKKVDCKKCKAAFKKLTKDEINTIFITLPNYILSKPEKEFRKNPLTYINGKCWGDEIIKPATTLLNNQKPHGRQYKEFG